jgi:TolB-like protein
MSPLLHDLRKRHIVQVALIYLGVAWGFTEATGFLIDNYDLSRKLLDVVILLLILGFPAAVVIAWYHGERGQQAIARGEVVILTTLLVLAGVGTYRIGTAEQTAGPGIGGSAPADLGRRSVAVLPFTNNTGADSLDWLGPGLSDLLTSNLAQIQDLSVVSPQRLFALLREQGREETGQIPDQFALQIASRAGAHIMARGSILGSADDVRIDVQLIDLDDGTVLGAERARGNDVFALADTLARKLSERLLGTLADAEPNVRSPLALTGGLEAYRRYQSELRESWRELDSADIGGRYRLASMYEQMPGRTEEHRKVLLEILEIDSMSAPAYYSLARIAAREGDREAVDSLAARFEALEPDRGTVHQLIGQLYEETGRLDAARERYVRIADATDGGPALEALVRTFLREGRPEAGREAIRPYLDGEDPGLVAEAAILTADSYVWEGRFAEGLALYRDAEAAATAANRQDLRSASLKSALDLEDLLASERPSVFNRSIWKLLELERGERALDLIDAASELHLRDSERLVPVAYYVLQYARGRALELLDRPAQALHIYTDLLEGWGETVSQVPLMSDLPDRVTRLQRTAP